jgi:hypothetical protein
MLGWDSQLGKQTDEHVTVLSGTFSIGMGDKLDQTQDHDFKAGGYAVACPHESFRLDENRRDDSSELDGSI